MITDEFDVDYLKYYQAGTLEIKGRNAEGDEFDTNGTVTPQVTAKGVNFTLTNLPKNNGNYYTTYRLTYDLIVKDAQTLEKLNKEAFQNENNQGKVLNNSKRCQFYPDKSTEKQWQLLHNLSFDL